MLGAIVGDTDTICAIVGGIAEAYYGIPNNIKNVVCKYLDKRLLKIVKEFIKKY